MIKLNTNRIFYNNFSPAFKHHTGFTPIWTDDDERIITNNKTSFMRNYPTLEFTKDYIVKNFPNGTNIAEFGCSTGQKPFSLLIMLDDYNKDEKYKIHGYDFPEIIGQMKTNLYSVEPHFTGEDLLFENSKSLDFPVPKQAEYLRKKFFSFFPVCCIDELTGKEEQREYRRLKSPYNIVVRLNKDKIKDVIDFKPGNINNIDKILEKDENGVIIFQNALYHILNIREFGEIPTTIRLEKVFELFKKINKMLPENGIFVLGNLPADHMYTDESKTQTRLAYQNNERIKVFDSSKVHNMLYACGFEPVYYEKVPSSTPYCLYNDVYLPSVWKKSHECGTN